MGATSRDLIDCSIPATCPSSRGTLIRLQVEHLPGDHNSKPVWLWSSTTDASSADIDQRWQSFLCRFDLAPPRPHVELVAADSTTVAHQVSEAG